MREWNTDHGQASLFERLQKYGRNRSNDGASKKESIVSIKNNLQRIFNAKPGECHASYDQGIFDLNNPLSDTDEIRDLLCHALSFCIAKYEPRIKGIAFKFRQDNDYFLRYFTILAHLAAHSLAQEKIEIDIYIDNNRFQVL